MTKEFTNVLKSVACLLIFIHHYFMYSSGIVQILGFWMVSLFFFLSAYGISISLRRKITFLKYIKKRLTVVIIPYILVNVFVIIFSGFKIPTFTTANPVVSYVNAPSALDYLLYLLGIRMIDSIMWYINVLLIFYVLIYFTIYFKKVALKIIYIFAITIIYMVVAKQLGLGFYTYTGIWGFPFGVLFAYCDHIKLLHRFCKMPLSIILSFCGLLCTAFLLVFIQTHYIPLPLFFPLSYSLIIFNCLFVYCVGTRFESYSFSRNIATSIFSISYEFYLLHMKVLVVYYLLFESYFQKGCLLLNVIFIPFLLVSITIVLSFLYHKFISLVVNYGFNKY